ncbi:MAG TPA: flagellar biosynthesis anti-sigma factor FlgM [Sphingomonas sp.]
MINSIGISGTSGGTSLVDAARQQGTQRTDAAGRPLATGDGNAVSTTISRLAAGGPPVDTDRIASLRAAIKSGTYRADPGAIASAMVDSDFGASL